MSHFRRCHDCDQTFPRDGSFLLNLCQNASDEVFSFILLKIVFTHCNAWNVKTQPNSQQSIERKEKKNIRDFEIWASFESAFSKIDISERRKRSVQFTFEFENPAQNAPSRIKLRRSFHETREQDKVRWIIDYSPARGGDISWSQVHNNPWSGDSSLIRED